MAANALVSLTFGRSGNAREFQVDGWSGPEHSLTWTMGHCAQLQIPRIPPDDYLMTIRAGAFCVRIKPWQRVRITLGESEIGQFIADDERDYRVWIPKDVIAASADPMRLYFDLPDATSPAAHGINAVDGRLLGLSFRTLAIQPIGGSALARFVRATESIGRNCEFGTVQRELGFEPISLLRWAGGETAGLIDGLVHGFDGLGDVMTGQAVPATHPPDQQYWWMTCSRYGITFHTDSVVAKTTSEEARVHMHARLRWLARKLLEDIEAGEKLLVYGSKEFADPMDGMALVEAIRAVGGTGPILIVASGANEPVRQIAANIWGARVSALTEMLQANTLDLGQWFRVLEEMQSALPKEWLDANIVQETKQPIREFLTFDAARKLGAAATG